MSDPERRKPYQELLAYPAVAQSLDEISMLGLGETALNTWEHRNLTTAVKRRQYAPNFILHFCRHHLTGIPGFENFPLLPSAAAPIMTEGLQEPQPHELNVFANAFFAQDALLGQQMLLRTHTQNRGQETLDESYQTLKACAVYQARQTENPISANRISGMVSGQIPHEIRTRSDPVRLDLERSRNWRFPYYGSRLSTPLFISFFADVIGRDGGLDEHFLQEEKVVVIN
ncbi:hypothetical protein M1271_04525 [Patescibacteria group bacterium]|nr:hypothetical protein [Patescibacteria group bacterium]MCL5798379.1 hypothetical protein [Patescibacteria group bacterium]